MEPSRASAVGQPWNNPQLAAFLGLGEGEALELGPVPEETNVLDPQSGFTFTPQGAINVLMRFRAEFPFVPVMPFPPQVRTVFLVQNVAQDIEIPSMAQIIIFRGSGNYYVSNHGKAEIPADTTSRSVYKPEGFAWYVGGSNSLSLITPDAAGCPVSILAYVPQELPRYAG